MSNDVTKRILGVGLIALPWLNPLASGPLPATDTFIFAWSCAALLTFCSCILTSFDAREDIGRIVALGWLVAAGVSSCIALSQYFGYSASWSPWVSAAPAGEAFANLRQRNQFATLTSMGLLALLSLVLTSQRHLQNGKLCTFKPCAWVGVCTVLLAFGNAASGSRTGLLQWVLVFVLTVLCVRRDSRHASIVCAGALVAYLVAAFMLPVMLEATTGVQSGGPLARFLEPPGCSSRSVLWTNVLHLIVQKPWFGWGWGELDFAHFTTLYPGERFCDILDNAHNLPLHVAVELGLPIALALCSGFVWWVMRNKPWTEQHPTRQLAWGVLAVIGLHSLLEYPLWYGPFQMAVILCLVLLRLNPRSQPNMAEAEGWGSKIGVEAKGAKRLFSHNLVTICAVVVLAFCSYAGWDYWRIGQLYLAPEARAAAYRNDTYTKVKDSWLFQNQVQFADLTTQNLDRSNAMNRNVQAKRLLHFSPEPRVVEAIIESAVMLGDDKEALYYLQRYKAAFPKEHALWAAASARYKTP